MCVNLPKFALTRGDDWTACMTTRPMADHLSSGHYFFPPFQISTPYSPLPYPFHRYNGGISTPYPPTPSGKGYHLHRQKQCRPNETKPYPNASNPCKRLNSPTNGHTPSRIESTHTRLTCTGTRPHAFGQQAGDHPVPAHTERHVCIACTGMRMGSVYGGQIQTGRNGQTEWQPFSWQYCKDGPERCCREQQPRGTHTRYRRR